MPSFEVVYAGSTSDAKTPSHYLMNQSWIDALKEVVKGVGDTVPIDEALIKKANSLADSMVQRLAFHIDDRVDETKQDHWTLRFTRDNIAPIAAMLCLFGHIVDDVHLYGLDECLLEMPMSGMFEAITGNLSKLEGCYLFYDKKKHEFIRSGKSSGVGADACFEGRLDTHEKNSKLREQMMRHVLYRLYPFRGVNNLGAEEGYFDHLVAYCGMAFDAKDSASAPLFSADASDGLFVWSEETINELKKKGELEKVKRDAIAYLWELCYDILLERKKNVSSSPGFESLGLKGK